MTTTQKIATTIIAVIACCCTFARNYYKNDGILNFRRTTNIIEQQYENTRTQYNAVTELLEDVNQKYNMAKNDVNQASQLANTNGGQMADSAQFNYYQDRLYEVIDKENKYEKNLNRLKKRRTKIIKQWDSLRKELDDAGIKLKDDELENDLKTAWNPIEKNMKNKEVLKSFPFFW